MVAVDVGVDAVGGAAPLDLGDAAGERVGPVAEADQVRPDAEGGGGAGCGGVRGHGQGTATEFDGPRTGHGDREEVGVADERGGELRTRSAVQLLGGAAVLEPGAVHDGDPVGEGERLDLVVGDVQDGDFGQLAVQSGQFGEHPGAEAGVEGGERFVQEQNPGPDGQRAGDGDALLLAAGGSRGWRSAYAAMPTSSRTSVTRPGISAFGVRWALRPKATLSLTLRCGKRAYCWTTMPMPRWWGGSCVTSRPPRKTRPAAGRTNPATARRAVVLPEPEGPRRAMTSPGSTVRSSRSRTTVPP